jgi:hypothetical protein
MKKLILLLAAIQLLALYPSHLWAYNQENHNRDYGRQYVPPGYGYQGPTNRSAVPHQNPYYDLSPDNYSDHPLRPRYYRPPDGAWNDNRQGHRRDSLNDAWEGFRQRGGARHRHREWQDRDHRRDRDEEGAHFRHRDNEEW